VDTTLITLAQTSADAVSVTSIWDFLLKGGIMMVPIGICSLVVVAVTLERSMVLRRKRIVPGGFIDGFERTLTSSTDPKRDGESYCESDGSPIAKIVEAGMSQFGRPIDCIERHIAHKGEHEVFELRRRLRVLSVVTAAAPLLGLVGTIIGMIKAFQTVALSAEALGRTEMLAEGIYEAMITTAAGLLVAIPSLIVYHWLSGKIERITQDMDKVCVRATEAIADAGHSAHRPTAPMDNHEDVSRAAVGVTA